jgi:hypothetical protein
MGDLQNAVLDRARSQLGYKESPANSNNNKYGQWYGMNYQPWCAMFGTWCAVLEGSTALAQGSRYSYCPYVEQDAAAGKHGLKLVSSGAPGDLITFDWDNDGVADHIGLVEKNLGGGQYQTLEGNTSTSSQNNGGQVMRRTRSGSVIRKFIRYPDEGGGFLMSLDNDQQNEVLRGARVMYGVMAYYEGLKAAGSDDALEVPDDVQSNDYRLSGWKLARNMFRTFDVSWGTGNSSKPDEAPTGVHVAPADPTGTPPVKSHDPMADQTNGKRSAPAIVAFILAAGGAFGIVGLVVAINIAIATGTDVSGVGNGLIGLLGTMIGAGAIYVARRDRG